MATKRENVFPWVNTESIWRQKHLSIMLKQVLQLEKNE